MAKIGFIGGGNMASAIINGIIKGKVLTPGEIAVCDPNEEKRVVFEQQGVLTYTNAALLAADCHYIVLSIKPQGAPALLEQIAAVITDEHVLISIVAGVTAQTIREKIGFPCKLVLVMPNTPLMLGAGSVAVARIEPIAEEDFRFAKSIFEQSGAVEVIPADKLNEVIPINGSSPAFVYQLAKIVCEHGKQYGFAPETSNRLFCNALIGSAKMMLESGKTHDELIKAVCSPGGATLKGMEALEENGLERAVVAYMDACVKRAYELGEKK